MFDPRTISMFLSAILLLHFSSAFFLKDERYKKRINEFEELETITDPVKVKLLMAQPAKEEIKFTPILIPDKFSKYDSIDHDGHISLKELIKTTGAERNAKNAFQAADEDADGEISQEEFKKAPWAMKPTSVDSKDDEDYIDETKFENVTVEEEVEADKVGRNGEGREDIEEEGDKERDAERVGDGERYEEGGEESFVGNVERRENDFVRGNEKENKLERVEEEKKDEVRWESERGDDEGGQEVIIEEDEKEGLEGDLKETEGGVNPVGGVEEVKAGKEKDMVGGVDRKVEVGESVGEEIKVGGVEEEVKTGKEKDMVGVDRKVEVGEGEPVGEESKVGGVEEEVKTGKEKDMVGVDRKVEVGEGEPVGEESKVGVAEEEVKAGKEKDMVGGVDRKVEVGEGNMGEIENTRSQEKGEEADYTAESKDEEYIELGDLEKDVQRSNLEILDLHKLGSIPDKTDGQLDVRDNFIEDDLESRDWIDVEETSGELKEINYNQESYSDEERNTSEESHESSTD